MTCSYSQPDFNKFFHEKVTWISWTIMQSTGRVTNFLNMLSLVRAINSKRYEWYLIWSFVYI